MIHRIDKLKQPETMADCKKIRDDAVNIGNCCKECVYGFVLPRNYGGFMFFHPEEGQTTHYDCTLYMAFVGLEQNYDHAQNQKKYLLG